MTLDLILKKYIQFISKMPSTRVIKGIIESLGKLFWLMAQEEKYLIELRDKECIAYNNQSKKYKGNNELVLQSTIIARKSSELLKDLFSELSKCCNEVKKIFRETSSLYNDIIMISEMKSDTISSNLIRNGSVKYIKEFSKLQTIFCRVAKSLDSISTILGPISIQGNNIVKEEIGYIWKIMFDIKYPLYATENKRELLELYDDCLNTVKNTQMKDLPIDDLPDFFQQFKAIQFAEQEGKDKALLL